jgi:serine/threonine protein phosphatase PrpC
VPLTTRAFGLTDVGCVRKKNEDSYILDDGLGLFVVADGMGGHAGGDVASAEAIDQIFAMVKRHQAAIDALKERDSEDNRGAVKRAVEAAIQAATYMVFGIAEQDPSRKGMGTTISAMLFIPQPATGGALAIVGQVGDSRVYLIRDGVPVQITEDHTLVNLQLKAGVITREQAKTVTYQNLITRAVGVKDYVEVDTLDVECKPGDRFILCSDGVHGYIDEEAQLKKLCEGANIEAAAKNLIDHALKRGGRDNATAIVVDVAA